MTDIAAAIAALGIAPLGEAWRLSGDWLIVGDVHVPFTDWQWAERVLAVARQRKIRNLLIAGDFFDLSQFSLYIHVITPPTWAQEREAARIVLKAWLTWFHEIRIIMGNHDRRLQKFTAGAFEEADILALVTTNQKVTINGRGFAVIDTPQGEWRITHPRNYSINRLTVASDLAAKHDQHILSFHEHHVGLGWDRYGRHCVVNGGCLVDPGKLAYVSLDDSKSAAMSNGFVTLINGVPTIYANEPITDWSKIE